MVKAWRMKPDAEVTDCQQPNKLDDRELTMDECNSLTGVEYHFIPADDSAKSKAELENLRLSRGYVNFDVCDISPAAFGSNWDEKRKIFYAEHLHLDEEIRYILDGRGYFDLRSSGINNSGGGGGEEWIRIRVEKGDLLIVPAGIYHRFTTDPSQYVKAMRLFKQAPQWTPYNRGVDTDKMSERIAYVQVMKNKHAEKTN